MEDLLNGFAEEPCERERERERGDVAALLDRDDRLSRDVDRAGEVALRQLTCGPQLPDVVPHAVKLALQKIDVERALRREAEGAVAGRPDAVRRRRDAELVDAPRVRPALRAVPDPACAEA